jgi:hypothetical protein
LARRLWLPDFQQRIANSAALLDQVSIESFKDVNAKVKGRSDMNRVLRLVKRRSKGTPDRRRRGTPFSDNMMLVC